MSERKRNKAIAKTLRKNTTDAESKLWEGLHSRRLGGFKFRRQHAIGKYVVDFVCLEKNIVVEADGSQHLDSPKDIERTQWLEGEGYSVLRFWNLEIMKNPDDILRTILHACENPQDSFEHPPPNPLPSAGRGN